MTESLSDRYLGLLAMVGTDRSDCFRHLVDRVCMRTNEWKEKTLSLGGKEVLFQVDSSGCTSVREWVSSKFQKKKLQRKNFGCHCAILVGR
ncbi:hypothetical protein PR202_ga30142 [Eleusine coracana subsp. coracana]|uniref:Uncharacterized protein n=1 Tax=Eleusine coracana subsp. coracana TaxID=191504 RepID=A0AAV5DNX2_ELECO|nr:hypothetical protein PR202_ga30142 [Eleusine coracana subsp. coracana]